MELKTTLPKCLMSLLRHVVKALSVLTKLKDQGTPIVGGLHSFVSE
ncbi:hypothetical protein ACWN8V_12525 [Vagococcus elongatus]|nr:hypothetical protein [Vagococcus elongatus]